MAGKSTKGPVKKSSAQKRLEQSIAANLRNRVRKSVIKTASKQFEQEPTEQSQVTLVKALDKAAKTNVIHKNKASRLKSKIAKKLAVSKKA